MSGEKQDQEDGLISEKTNQRGVPSPTPTVQSWLGPYNEGVIDTAKGRAQVTGPCGDTMEIYLRIRDNRIIDGRFQVTGCAVSRACASAAAARLKGKSWKQPGISMKKKFYELWKWCPTTKDTAPCWPGIPCGRP